MTSEKSKFRIVSPSEHHLQETFTTPNGEDTLMIDDLNDCGEDTLMAPVTTCYYHVTTPHDVTDDQCGDIDDH